MTHLIPPGDSPEVEIIDGVAVTTSLAIAQYFNKPHDSILAEIEFLDISPLLKEPNFRESQYTPKGQAYSFPIYYLNKDGFFLFLLFSASCRGYAQVAQAYIMAFDYADESSKKSVTQLHTPPAKTPTDSSEQFDVPTTQETLAEAVQCPQVKIVNGAAVTTSLEIAKYFDRRHDDVLKSVRNLQVSDLFYARNFAETSYHDQLGRQQPMYHITKDGFIFLVMGFTGEKAAQIKEAYIDAFNRMEVRLAQQTRRYLDKLSFTTLTQLELSEMTIARYRQKCEKHQQMYEQVMQETVEMVSKIYLLCRKGFSQTEIAKLTPYREDLIALAIRFKPF